MWENEFGRTPTLEELEAIDGAPIKPHDKRFLTTVPTQPRSWNTLQRIVEATEAVLADRQLGREKFTTTDIIEQTGRDGKGEQIPVGLFYRYFSDRIAAMNYVWPSRQDTFFDPTNRPPVSQP